MGRYLFIDREHVQRIDGVQQVFHQPVKHPGPVLTGDRPWEGGGAGVTSPPIWCPHRAVWRLWYLAGPNQKPHYAESDDGILWRKPELGLVAFEGSKKNNIVDVGFEPKSPKQNRLVVIRDPNPRSSDSQYKALTDISSELMALDSEDGLTWRPIKTNCNTSDDEYRLGYDYHNNRFFAMIKLGGWDKDARDRVPEFGRAVSLTTSEDFIEWSEPELVFWGDEVDKRIGAERIEQSLREPNRRSPAIVKTDAYFTDVYNMPTFTYEDMYLAVPAMFHQSGSYFLPNGFSNQDGIINPQLVASRDLRHWDRLQRQRFIDHSLMTDPHNSDYGAIYATPPVLNGDELFFYYSGSRMTHVKQEVVEQAGLLLHEGEPRSGAVYLARLRRDGFTSMFAGADGGVVLTKTVKVTGSELHINADARGGEVRVEVRDARDHKSIPGYGMGNYFKEPRTWSPDRKISHRRMGTGCRPDDESLENDTVPITGDVLDGKVRWREQANVAALKGREVRLYIFLRRAHLYSFWFEG